jgi:hypothetical protein
VKVEDVDLWQMPDQARSCLPLPYLYARLLAWEGESLARLECKSVQAGIPSKWVEVDGITDAQVVAARAALDDLIATEEQVSDAVAMAFVALTSTCPTANPSDLWQHVIYRHLLARGWSDNRWKRVSGFALERAFVLIYSPRLEAYRIRMRIVPKEEANHFLKTLGTDIQATKVDLFLEGSRQPDDAWRVFGCAHCKSSIAERIQDDVPASLVFMRNGLLSVALTMDAKSYPPPHGECINYGELGGRSMGVEKDRIKRDYIEKLGQFDALFSFNLRTPPSGGATTSGKRILRMSLHEKQPDQLVRFISDGWTAFLKRGGSSPKM